MPQWMLMMMMKKRQRFNAAVICQKIRSKKENLIGNSPIKKTVFGTFIFFVGGFTTLKPVNQISLHSSMNHLIFRKNFFPHLDFVYFTNQQAPLKNIYHFWFTLENKTKERKRQQSISTIDHCNGLEWDGISFFGIGQTIQN